MTSSILNVLESRAVTLNVPTSEFTALFSGSEVRDNAIAVGGLFTRLMKTVKDFDVVKPPLSVARSVMENDEAAKKSNVAPAATTNEEPSTVNFEPLVTVYVLTSPGLGSTALKLPTILPPTESSGMEGAPPESGAAAVSTISVGARFGCATIPDSVATVSRPSEDRGTARIVTSVYSGNVVAENAIENGADVAVPSRVDVPPDKSMKKDTREMSGPAAYVAVAVKALTLSNKNGATSDGEIVSTT